MAAKKGNKAKSATVRVQQVSGLAGKPASQRQVVVALGLKRMWQVRELPDNPCVRGMVDKVPHLVRVVD